MAQDLQKLFEAVRKACPPAIWSRGIELTRADAVVGEGVEDDAVVFHVSTRGGMICPKVTLYPEDLEWDCDCPSRETVCEHIAAAVIAWRRSRDEGSGLPEPRRATGRVGYRFTRADGGLALERVIVRAGAEERLEATLVALSEGRVDGPRFLAKQADLAVELALGTHRRGLLPPPLVSRVFAKLVHCGDVQLDGEPVEVSAEPLLPVARLRDRGDGFVLSVSPAVSITERFANGILLCGKTLRFPGDPRLTARERDDLTRGRTFTGETVAELVTAVLPSLRKRIPVEIETERLPRTVDERPRIALDLTRSGDTLSVLPTLVYGDPPLARIDGGRLVHLRGPIPLRDERAERGELRRLARLDLAAGVRSEFTGPEAVAFAAQLESWGAEIRESACDHFRLAAPLEPGLSADADDFDVTFRSEIELPRRDGRTSRAVRNADPEAVLRAWRAGESLVPLLGGGWAPLPADWLERFGARVADLLAARGADGEVPRCCLPDLTRLCEELDEPPPAGMDDLRALAGSFEGIPDAPEPRDLATPLRPYQKRGVDWLTFVREAGLGAMLADDMGLGKTLQALCALRPPALVVAPTSVLHNWANEIRAHRPGLRYDIYHGPNRALDPEADVTLTTYAILRLDADRLAAERWETVVLDEAQRIKNPESQVAQAAFRLDARFRVTLSGTPVENRLDELWSQFHFVNRGLLGGRRHFQETYASPIATGDAEAAARLRERIRPFVLRRLKREVATELPPRTEMVLRCELTEPEREIYDTIRASTLQEVVRRLAGGEGVMAALEALLRLRQAACHGSLIPEREVERSAKLDLLMEALDTAVSEGHKALVFSQWTSLLDLTETLVRDAQLGYVRLDGATRDREGVVRRFQEEADVSLMLISLKAGGTGLNLTAADHIFLLDPWWNPAVEDQAADRAHRIGQDRPVMIYRLVAMDTVEERILELQQRKRELAELALEGTGRAAGLTRDDLMDLLG
jgi:superfamily II DNA or RNA helicase